MSKVKSSPKLIKDGKLSYEWARSHMQILDNTITRHKKSKPLKGITLGFCLHITKETSVLLMGAKELGATVAPNSLAPISKTDVSFVTCKQKPRVIPLRGFDFFNRLIVLSKICI